MDDSIAHNPGQRVEAMLYAGALGDGIGNGAELLDFGFCSDDTQHTAATCEAIASLGCVDAEALSVEYARYHSLGRLTGLGAATLEALAGLQQRATGRWWDAEESMLPGTVRRCGLPRWALCWTFRTRWIVS